MGSRTFTEEFPELFRLAYRAAHRITGDAGVAEDLAAEALTRAALRWNRIGDRARPWVVRVASNLAIDHLRHLARRPRVDPDRSDARTVDRDRSIDLHRALRTLPRRQREVVVLRYVGDLTEAEIAAELGLAPGTVKSHASRGLRSLRAVLEDRSESPAPHLEAPS